MFRSKVFTIINILAFVAIAVMLTLQLLELHAYRCLPFIDK